MGQTLTILAPGLLGPWPAAQCRFVCEGLQVPALSLLFARGEVAPTGGGDDSLSGALCQAFAVPKQSGGWPVAALTYLADSVQASDVQPNGIPAVDGPAMPAQSFLRADPVHLEAQPHGAQVIHGDALALTHGEALALAEELAELPAPGPPQALAATRWYVPVGAVASLTTHPLDLTVTRVRESLLPGGADGPGWRVWLTHAQMMLHAAPLNERRVDRGLAPINSLWLWGAGELPPPGPALYARVLGDDPLLAGLCRQHDLEHRGLEHHQRTDDRGLGDWTEVAASLAPEGHTLLLWSDACSLARRGEVERWRDALMRFEQALAAPLLAALRAAELEEVQLLAPPVPALKVVRGQLWRWWRRKDWLHYIVGIE